MMKNIKSILMMMAALTLVWGCTSDDSTDVTQQNKASFTSVAEAPAWNVDFSYNQAKPEWTPIDHSEFEGSMVIVIKLQAELSPYSTDDDLMAVFIDGVCHTVAPRNINVTSSATEVYFVLNIYGTPTNENKTEFRLSYYSGGLHQTFTLTQSNTIFLNEFTVGTDTDFEPVLTYGSSKYPVISILDVTLPSNPPFIISNDDIVAAFVGNECRGKAKPNTPLPVYLYNEDEVVTVRYYSSEKKGIYTSPQSINTKGDVTNFIINF